MNYRLLGTIAVSSLCLGASCTGAVSPTCEAETARCQGNRVEHCVDGAWVESQACERCAFGACVLAATGGGSGATGGGSSATGGGSGATGGGSSATGGGSSATGGGSGATGGGSGPTCGNGAREGSEACDGSDLSGKVCQSLGFTGGTLTCSSACTLLLGGCTRSGPYPTATLASGELISYPGRPTTNIAVDGTSVYWSTGDGEVRAAPLAGGNAITLATGQPPIVGIAVTADALYFAASDPNDTSATGVIRKVPLTGGLPVDVATAQPSPSGIAVDATHVYWSNLGTNFTLGQENGSVLRAPLAGGAATTVVSGVMANGVTVDQTQVYWFNRTNEPWRAPKSGGAGSMLAPVPPSPSYISAGFASDGTNLFWLEGDRAIYASPVGGGAPVLVHRPTMGLGLTGLAIDATTVYFTFLGEVRAVAKTGGATRLVAPAQASPTKLTVDGTSVYWTTFGMSRDGAVRVAPK